MTACRVVNIPDPLANFERVRNGCWYWRGALTKGGYACAGWEGRTRLVHRVLYRLLIGPIGRGKTLDHLCRHRHCVNPFHLEPVTRRENILRGQGIAAKNARKTKCKRGHPFDAMNTRRDPDGTRHCRRCGHLHDKRRHHIKREELTCAA